MHRNFSEGIGFFVRKNIEDMVGKYGIDAEKAESRYYIYTAMAEMAYMLSCCHEEGKLLVCKMAYADSRNDSIKDILISNGEYLEFREPFEFRIDVLEKMALSAGGGNTYIVVSGDSPDELKILGLYTFNNDLGQIWHRAQMEGNMGNLPVNIRIKKPGVISFCLGPVEMLEFEHNNVYREKPLDRMVGSAVFKAKLFGDSSRVLQYAEDALDGDLSIPVVSCYETAISFILETMLHEGHGGMLVIVENDFDESPDMAIKYRFNDNDILMDKVKEWQLQSRRADSGLENTSADLFRQVKYLCNFIAHMSTVDGALVIKKNLQLVGYGAELKTGVSKSNISYYDIDRGNVANFENKGTRHRSGCRYCYQDMDAVVFVVSQDGAVSGMTYYDGLFSDKERKRIPTNKVMLTHGREMVE